MTENLVQEVEAPTADPGGPADAAGRLFAGMFRLLKSVRPDRPLHPEGLGLSGTLLITGSPAETSGVDWLDSPGTGTVAARFSRSIGLPQALPDVLGLALRVTTEPGAGSSTAGNTGPADLLFASTGWRLPGRFLLQPRLDVDAAALSTLMPYRGRKGPVLLGLRTISLPPGPLSDGEWVLGLYWARPAGAWRPCGELRLHAAAEPGDTSLRFDPLAHQPPGADAYAWTRRLRERSYREAQRSVRAAVVGSGTQGPGAHRPGAVSGRSGTPARRRPIPASPETGRNTMSTVSQLFNTPAADVWRVIADGWLYSGWVVGASRIRAVDDHWPQAGAKLHHSVGAWPLVINDSTKVTSVDHGRSLELVARGWPMGEAIVVITVEDRGSSCLVTIVEDAIRGPGKLMPKVVRDAIISFRNRETLKRLELMAAGGAGR